MFRFNGEPAIGLAMATAQGANNLPSARLWRRRMEADQGRSADRDRGAPRRRPVDVARAAVSGFTKALWEAIAIVLAVSFLTLGIARRRGRRVLDPARAWTSSFRHGASGISLQRISLGALDHFARPPRRRRDDDDRDDGQPARGGGGPRSFGHACLGHDRVSDADRNARHGRRVCADRLREERRRRILLLAVRGHCRRAISIMDRRGNVCAGNRRYDPAKDDEGPWRRPWGTWPFDAAVPRRSGVLHARPLARYRGHRRAVCRLIIRIWVHPAAILPGLGPAGAGRRSKPVWIRRYTRPSAKSSGSRRC